MGLTNVQKTYGLDSKNMGIMPRQYWVKITVDFDSSYPTGGEALALPNESVVEAIHLRGGSYHYEYDSVNAKIKAFDMKQAPALTGATGGAAANGALVDQTVVVTASDGASPGAAALKSDVDARLETIADNMNELIAALFTKTEVASTTDLSGETGIEFLVLVDQI